MTADRPTLRAPPSPCIGVCLMDLETRQCRGCLRTAAEIGGWPTSTPDEKRALIAILDERRRNGGAAIVQ